METIFYSSDCCGEYIADEHVQYEVCPRCKEHCEIVTEKCIDAVDENGIEWLLI